MTKAASPQSAERVDPKTQGPEPEYPQPPISPPGPMRRCVHVQTMATRPVEIAPVFVSPVSNESRYVSGEVYGVTGGQMPY